MRSLSLVMSECSLSGRGQGHVSNFYIVDFKKTSGSAARPVLVSRASRSALASYRKVTTCRS